MRSFQRVLATLFSASLVLPCSLSAQIRASELASVSQTIDGTKLTLTYSRPRARGRTALYGTKVVRWGEVWTPGANNATTLETNHDVMLNGKTVPAGKYSMWFVVREHGDWTLVLDTNTTRFHMNPPDTTKVKVSIPVQVQEAPFTEVLTWSFPDVQNTGGKLAFAWGPKQATFDLKVQPSLHVELSRAEADAYVGRYTFASKKHPDKPRGFTVMFDRDTLKAQWDTTNVGDGLQGPLVKYFGRFALIRVAPDWFVPGLFDEKGEIYEVIRPGMVFEFNRQNGRVQSFDIRDIKDEAWASAQRKQ